LRGPLLINNKKKKNYKKKKREKLSPLERDLMNQGSGLYSIRISGNIYPPIKGGGRNICIYLEPKILLRNRERKKSDYLGVVV